MAKDDRSALRDEIQELQEDAALADKAKKTARHTEVLTERIKPTNPNSKEVLATHY